MSKWLTIPSGLAAPSGWERLFRRSSDQAVEGIVVLDAAGTLVYANDAWSRWTGFSPEELLHQRAPFPFWIGHRELPLLAQPEAPGMARLQGVFPFRHRSDTVFWCDVSSVVEEVDGVPLTVALLRRVDEGPSRLTERPVPGLASLLAIAEAVPFALALTDRQGKLLWANRSFSDSIRPLTEARDQPLSECFRGISPAALEHLFHVPLPLPQGRVGRLLVRRCDGPEDENEWMAYWFATTAAGNQGFLFAFSDYWESICPLDDVATAWQRAARPPVPLGLPLLLRPGGEVQFWDERWQALTGLTAGDLAGVPTEVVLDWLFPRQPDRDRAADLLHQTPTRGARHGFQAVLEVLTRTGSRPLACTFLPVPGEGAQRWLLLVGLSDTPTGDDHPNMVLVRQFARGLSHLLNHSLSTPLGAAELALEQNDLPPDVAALLEQIQDGCRRVVELIALLQDLGTVTPGDVQVESLADVVREFVEEEKAVSGERSYELRVDQADTDAPVRANRRMLKTVLKQLLANAEEALVNSARRRIEIRVISGDDGVRCEIEDSGEGLLTEDWTRVVAPFYSTKGPFARDTIHAALEGNGLGLTVCQHLLALQGGRLELKSKPGAGTTATIVLPLAKTVPGEMTSGGSENRAPRTNSSEEATKAHAGP
jgi:PAS domain S-box-containing protein